ncbi:hypothetical protein [Lutimonas sp.]|uniref:hypothetical protein n=1 Tax=Lutimonas sp. TaxID=1872403 RepID=UPI003D9AEF64
MQKFLFLMGFLLLYSVNTNGQTCCSGGIPLSNSIGLPIENQGAWQFSLSYDYNRLNTLLSGSDRLDDDSRLRITQSLLFNTGYTITNNLSVEFLLTYVNQKREINQFGNTNLDETYGIGDAVLLFKYNFNNIFGGSNTLRLGAGPKIPFGATDKRNDNGILLNPDLQPGSGAWDLILWSTYLQSFDFRPSGTFAGSLIYRHTGTNNNYFNNTTTYRFGSEFQAFLNYTDQFVISKTLIDPGLGVKYRQAGNDEIAGAPLENTGGKWVNLVPSLNIHLSKKLLLISKAELPVYNYVEGTQLTPTYRITAGLFLTLSKKGKNELQNLNNEL